MVPEGPLDGLLRARSELLETAAPGLRAARLLSDLTDEAIRKQAHAAEVRVPYALFALGGYGAGRLLPGSDIDLLVVTRGSKSELEPLVRAVLYPLWDAGLTVGHQIRTPKGQVEALAEDLTIATSFLTARQIAGDERLGSRVLADSFRKLRRIARKLQTAILQRDRPGSPYLLEPDLKDGCGGQRDLDELVWHAALRAGSPVADCDSLAVVGLLTVAECSALAEAGERIAAARWALHLDDTRAGNLLTLEVAESARVDAGALQRSFAETHHTLLAFRERLRGAAFADEPALTLDGLRALASGDDSALATTERAAHERRYEGVVPGFAEMMTLRRPALSHRYTVGAHCLRVVSAIGGELDSLGSGRVPGEMRDAALVAALAHDAGKREPAPAHAARSAGVAEAAARALGLTERQASAAQALAREHLLLSEIAAHADTSDEDVVLSAAARIGDRDLVAPLFALTAADMRATGPEAWTSWRAAVIGDLAAKLEDALSSDVDGAGIVAAAEITRASALREAAKVGASRAVLDFLGHAPLRYLAGRSPAEVLRDARLVLSIAGPGAPGRFAFSVEPGPSEHTWVVDVVTRDRRGLFASISGSLALCGLDVHSAEAYTDSSGIALDTFVVAPATLACADSATWSAFERTLGAALDGTLALDTRLAERRKHYPPRARMHTPITVVVGTRGPFGTPVRVTAPDRVGLLHDIARAIEAERLDIRRAAIGTTSGVAADTFELTDPDGAPPEPDAIRERLTASLVRACATSPAP
ncbi:MAG: HD domain-containing protein [Actinobacteria bacterium]|nr:HD domain-containing protein [Actinomycetota bacterium]